MIDISVSLEESDFENLIRQYHLMETDLDLIQSMTDDLKSRLKCKFNYQIIDNIGYGVITLGMEFDHFQEEYNQNGRLYETLLLEYLGAEMLSKLYEVCNAIVTKETGFYVKEYLFSGSEIPIQTIAEICDRCGENVVTYNKAYTMFPKKSVAFLMMISNNRDVKFMFACSKCGNKNCMQRKG